jgi:hypothetical protein
MDPLSIVSCCVSLAAGVTNLTAKITLFALEIRGAKKDMDAVARELASLNLCLNVLEHDQRRRIVLPEDIRQHIPEVLKNCEMITKQMNELLLKLQSGKLGRRIQWAFAERQEMHTLRSSLESNKTALEIALSMGTIQLLTQQKSAFQSQTGDIAVVIQQTEQISLTTTKIDHKMDDIGHALDDLCFQFSKLSQSSMG